MIKNGLFRLLGILSPLTNYIRIQFTPKLIADVGANPTAAPAPTPNASEVLAVFYFIQALVTLLWFGGRILFKPIDYPIHHIIWESPLALVFPLTLYFYNLFVFANGEGWIKIIRPMIVAFGMLDGENKIGVRFYLICNCQIISSRIVHTPKRPGSIKDSLVSFHTYFIPQKVNQFYVALHAIGDGVVTCMIRHIVQVCFACSDNESIEVGEGFKQLI